MKQLMNSQELPNGSENDLFMECNSYLDRLASEVQLVQSSEVKLYDDLKHEPQHLWQVFNYAIQISKHDLAKMGLCPRILWAMSDHAADLEPAELASIRLRAEASVLIVRHQLKSNANTYYILFSQTLVREIYLVFDSMLSLSTVLKHVGLPSAEKALNILVQRPTDSLRRSYAKCLSERALEFAFLHEFYHVTCGHLDKLYHDHNELAMYAVGTHEPNNIIISDLHKLLEIDADLMAVAHIMLGIRNNNGLFHSSSGNGNKFQEFIEEQFEIIGFSLTVFFRLVELWRRDVRLVYENNSDHPHPDIRDGCIVSYVQNNASDNIESNKRWVECYKLGRDAAIYALHELDGTIPSFEIRPELGQNVAIQETDSLLVKLRELRATGLGAMDFRTRHKQLQ